MAEEAGCELFQRTSQTEVLFDEVDAGLATHLTRQRQVTNVDHVHILDTVTSFVDVEDATVVVSTHLSVLRVQHDEGEHFTVLVTDDASERVAVQQQRNDDLLEMVLFGDTDVWCVKPRWTWTILKTHTFLPNVGINGECGDGVGNQPDTGVHRPDFE